MLRSVPAEAPGEPRQRQLDVLIDTGVLRWRKPFWVIWVCGAKGRGAGGLCGAGESGGGRGGGGRGSGGRASRWDPTLLHRT